MKTSKNQLTSGSKTFTVEGGCEEMERGISKKRMRDIPFRQ